MRVYRGREWRVDFDNYGEHVKISGGVTVDHQDLGYSYEEVREMSPEERAELFNELQDLAESGLSGRQVEELKATIPQAGDRSFVHDLFDPGENEREEEKPPRRNRRPRRTSRSR